MTHRWWLKKQTNKQNNAEKNKSMLPSRICENAHHKIYIKNQAINGNQLLAKFITTAPSGKCTVLMQNILTYWKRRYYILLSVFETWFCTLPLNNLKAFFHYFDQMKGLLDLHCLTLPLGAHMSTNPIVWLEQLFRCTLLCLWSPFDWASHYTNHMDPQYDSLF